MAKITVKGVGAVKTKPDYVEILLSLNVVDKDYTAAVNKANEKIEKLQNALSAVGYAKDDLKTLNFNVSTEYDYVQKNGRNERVFRGYNCSYSLKLGFDFTAKALANTLTAIANSGADAEFSIRFTVKEPEKVSEALLASATENARKKAEILCKASGKTLGELVSIDYNWSEISVYSDSNYALAAAPKMMLADACVPEFTSDDIDSSDSVAFVWEIN